MTLYTQKLCRELERADTASTDGECRNDRRLAIALSLLVTTSPAAVAIDEHGSWRYTMGAEYSSGDYGGSKSIDEWYLPFTVRYLTGPWVLRLTVPYIEVTAPSGTVVTGGEGGDFIVTGPGPRTTESGLGDIIAGVTYRDLLSTERSDDLAVDLTGKVKFGTADEDKGLGTGENDYTIQTDIYKFINRFTPYAMLGYRFRGDPPDANLHNSWLLMLGTSYDVSNRVSWSIDYYYAQASSRFADDAGEVTAGLDYRTGNAETLRGYLFKGVSDGSPEWGAGVMVTFRR